MSLVQQNEMNEINCKNTPCTFSNPPHFASINQQIEILKQFSHRGNDIVDKFRLDQERFMLLVSKYQEINERLSTIPRLPNANEMQMGHNQGSIDHQQRFLCSKLDTQRNAMQSELNAKVVALNQLAGSLVKNMTRQVDLIGGIISTVLDKEVTGWKRLQQLAGNGGDCDTSYLDILQTWCEALGEVIWENMTKQKEASRIAEALQQIGTDMVEAAKNLKALGKEFAALLSRLVLNTFILEKQPPQVMKTNTRFSAKIRFLVGSKLNIHMNPPVVKVSIISEFNANLLLNEKHTRGEFSGEILNHTGTMEYDNASKQLSITFRNMQLKKIRRAEKKGSESVVDEKFSLFFNTKFILDRDLEFNVWTMSLPVTVIVHGNQEPHAWATITWDNAFSEAGRRPFVVPDKVPWGKVASALNLKFNHVTGRHLSNDNIKYLAEKLFRTPFPPEDCDTLQVAWAQFSKESLIERNFTFWDWFYAIMKLTKEHLKPLWTEGHILGFMKKQEAEDLLTAYPLGTFLLRFSDSELGGITIAWVEGTEEKKVATSLQPFTAKDFAIRSLADRLNDLRHLLYLYPDIPKDRAFGRHYTPVTDTQTPSSNGYVKPMLVTTVPGVPCYGADRLNGCNSYPTTPSVNVNSPDAPSTMSEPTMGGSWQDPFTMDYENIINDNMMSQNDFADFGVALQDPPVPGGVQPVNLNSYGPQ